MVVPVYNVEKYLSQCLDSLVNQTYKNIEIICVNDGSTDKSGDILEEYQKKDSRIKVVSQPNGGLSKARNTGMMNAQGEYIGFVDSDDWCNPEMYGKLYDLTIGAQVDFVMCGMTLYDMKKDAYESENQYFSLGMLEDEWEGKICEDEYFKEKALKFNVTACNKLFRRDFLVSNQLAFREKLFHEDEFFFLDIYPFVKKFAFTKKQFYIYRVNSGNTIMSNYDNRRNDFLKFIKYQAEQVALYEWLDSYESKFQYWIRVIRSLHEMLEKISEVYQEDFYKKIREFLKSHSPSEKVLKMSFFLQEQLELYGRCKTYQEMKEEKGKQKYPMIFVQRVVGHTFIRFKFLGASVLKKSLDNKWYFLKMRIF